MHKKTVIILGAGFAGLGCALKLADEFNVILVEKQETLGGVVASVDYNGIKIPWGSHWILSTDKTLLYLVNYVGLEKRLLWEDVKMGFYYEGKIYGISNPINLLKFKPLPFADRIKFAFFALKLKLIKQKNLEGQSAKKWLTKFASKNICDNLFEPLSKIKFNQTLEDVSASWLYNRLMDTIKGGEKYGFVSGGGFESLIDGIEEKIKQNGGRILTSVNVKRISAENGIVKGIEVEINNKNELIQADAVVSTIPTPILPKIVDLPKDFADQLSHIKYKYIINAFYIIDKKFIEGFDWVNFCYGDLPFGGILQHDLKIYSGESGEDGTILYVFTYLNEDSDLWKKSEKDISEAYIRELEKVNPEIRKIIKYEKVTKSNLAWPIYNKDYSKYMPGPITPIKGLFLAGIYCTYPKMPSTGVAAESGFETAEEVKKYLKDGT